MWDAFINFLVWVIESFANIFGDYGLAIIAMTVIFRLLLTPLTLKQMRSSAKMQVLQPQIQAIQDRYADDPKRMQEEMVKFQSENDFNPLGGCLPMLLQWPIFIALFGALRNISAAHPDAGFLNIMPSISQSAQGAFTAWQSGTGSFGEFAVYALFVLLFGAMITVPMLMNSQQSAQTQAANTTKIMAVVMGAMMMWMGWGVAGGVLLYYNTSSLWGVIQQQLITKRIVAKYKEEAEAKLGGAAVAPVEVKVERREKSKRPTKKR